MTEQQIEEFDSLYQQACEKMKGLIILDGYRPKGIGFFEKIRANKAIEYFEQALAIYPYDFPSMFFIGKLYQRLGNYEAALSYLEKALNIEHENHSLPQEASLVAMHLNQFDKAIEYSNEALKRSPNNIALLGNHSMNLLIAGRDDEALAAINKAMSIDSTDEINQYIKSKIENVISGQEPRPTFENSLEAI